MAFANSPERRDKAVELSANLGSALEAINPADMENVIKMMAANHRESLINFGKLAEHIEKSS